MWHLSHGSNATDRDSFDQPAGSSRDSDCGLPRRAYAGGQCYLKAMSCPNTPRMLGLALVVAIAVAIVAIAVAIFALGPVILTMTSAA